MKTLPANFSAKLQKRTEWDYSYVVKMVGSSNTYYFSNEYFTADDSGTVQVLGLLQKIPSIKEKVDIRSSISSVGGFSISIIDDPYNRFSDNFATEYFYRREISVYLRIDDLTDIDDMLLVYSGLFADWKIKDDIVTIDVINSTDNYNTLCPVDVISLPDIYGNLSAIDVPKPIIYGSHPFKFGRDGTSMDLTTRDANNMVHPVYLGMNDDQQHVYLIAGHELKTTNTTGFRAWMFDKDNYRYYKIDESYVTYTTSGNDTLILIEKDITAYHYIYAIQVTGSTGNFTTPTSGAGEVQNEENANDGDPTTYARIIMGAGGLEDDYAQIRYTFPYDDIYNRYTVAAHKGYIIGVFDLSDVDLDTQAISSTSTTDLESYTTKQLIEIYDQTGSTYLSEDFTIRTTATYTTIDPSQFDLYYAFKEVELTMTDIVAPDIFIACEGYKDDGSGTITGTPNALLENPSHIIESLLRDQASFTAIDTTALDTAATILSGWKHSFTIYERSRIKELIEGISLSSKSLFSINSENNADLFTFHSSYTTTKDGITKDEIRKITLSKTDISDVMSRLFFAYTRYSNTDEFAKLLYRNNTTIATNYGALIDEEITSEYIQDDTTAGYLADHYCKNSSVAFWGETHNVIEFETVDFRGLNYWDGATFKPFINLEMFDILEFDLDSWRKINGESWSGKQFLIIELTTNINNLKIKAVEL